MKLSYRKSILFIALLLVTNVFLSNAQNIKAPATIKKPTSTSGGSVTNKPNEDAKNAAQFYALSAETYKIAAQQDAQAADMAKNNAMQDAVAAEKAKIDAQNDAMYVEKYKSDAENNAQSAEKYKRDAENYKMEAEQYLQKIKSRLAEVDELLSKYKNATTDTDGDGVCDAFDKEPNTPRGASVEANGITKDTDKDGIPDFRDKEILTSQKCFPVNADGIGSCPESSCCRDLSKEIEKLNEIISTLKKK